MSVVPAFQARSSFLASCLVEGDSGLEKRSRRNKQCALLVSIALQILIVAAIILFPLLSKGENITARAIVVPIPPYSHGSHHPLPRDPSHSGHHTNACHFCVPRSIPPRIDPHANPPNGEGDNVGPPEIPGTPQGQEIPGLLAHSDDTQQPPPPRNPAPTSPLHRSELAQTALLIHRVEPVYPPLCIQIRKEGRVELHAIIATDGSIQSLEVLFADPLFIPSALSAVREWRYRPTILNGQAIEVDTHITVVYTLSH